MEGILIATTLINTILKRVRKNPLFIDCDNLFQALRNHEEVNFDEAHKLMRELREISAKQVGNKKVKVADREKFYNLYRMSLLFDAPHDFDSYLLYMEFNRQPKKRFYLPRRHVLKPLVDDYQALLDGEIDFLGISLPPRVGKSTLGVFFITMLMGKYPDEANVMSGHSDKLTRGFYDEALSIVMDEQYNWKDVFPGHEFVTSAKEESIDVDKKRRFSTLTCRAIGATLTGAVEVKRCLYSDDLVADLEEALNPQRMQNKYDAYLNTLKDRKLDGSIEVMVGTRWGVDDPLGRIQEQYEDNPRYRFTVIPALNEKGESNFVYKYGLGFSTEYYLDMKASIDDATWCAKYMGNPYVREGLLFPKDSLRTYNGELPADIDKIVSVVDVAWGGGDYFTQIFAYISGDAIYVHDVICDKGDKTVTRPRSVAKLQAHMPTQTQYEANNGGDEYADNVDRELRDLGIKLNISSKKAPNNKSKMGRIIEYQPEIRDFYFRDTNHRDQDYKEFMNMITRYSLSGKNANDDAPDACAMLAELVRGHNNKFKVFKRSW